MQFAILYMNMNMNKCIANHSSRLLIRPLNSSVRRSMKYQKFKLVTSVIVLFFLTSCASAPTKNQLINADYGQEVLSKDCIAIAEQAVSKNLKDPLSVQFRHYQCSKGYWNSVPIMGLDVEFGYLQQGEVNAKNSLGGYVGFRPYRILIKNGYAIRYCIFSKDGICIPSVLTSKHNIAQTNKNTNKNSSAIQPETYDFVENKSKINVKFPSIIEWGNLVPLNINIKDSNQIKSIKITIPSNPKEHQRVLHANLNNPKVQQFISTRVRFTESNNGKVLISVTNGNNEQYNKVYSVGKINNPTNYEKESSLYSKFGKELPENSKIGFSKIKVDNDKLQVKTIIKHPMRPKIKNKKSFMLNKVDFYFDKKHAISMEIGDGLSNNPFISLGVQSAPESVKVVWKDSYGNEFIKSN